MSEKQRITSATVSMIVSTEAIRAHYDGNAKIDQVRYEKVMADRQAMIEARPDYEAAAAYCAERKNFWRR